MLKKILAFQRKLALILKGVSPQIAWFFGNWDGSGNFHFLRQIRKERDDFRYLPNQNALPESCMHYFNGKLSQLEDKLKCNNPCEINGRLVLQANANGHLVNVMLQANQNLCVFDEVFKELVYGFKLNGNCIVVDVGMNIGTAALYFATLPNVSRVYGFELVQSTFDLAAVNFKLNPALEEKITAINYGWGLHTGKFLIGNTHGGDTDATLVGASTFQDGSIVRKGATIVAVHSATDALTKIVDQHPGMPLVLKL